MDFQLYPYIAVWPWHQFSHFWNMEIGSYEILGPSDWWLALRIAFSLSVEILPSPAGASKEEAESQSTCSSQGGRMCSNTSGPLGISSGRRGTRESRVRLSSTLFPGVVSAPPSPILPPCQKDPRNRVRTLLTLRGQNPECSSWLCVNLGHTQDHLPQTCSLCTTHRLLAQGQGGLQLCSHLARASAHPDGYLFLSCQPGMMGNLAICIKVLFMLGPAWGPVSSFKS